MLVQEPVIPEFLVEVDGVVQAELWQRPADICLMFFPCRAVTSVASFTRLECPRPSCMSNGNVKWDICGELGALLGGVVKTSSTLKDSAAHLPFAVAAPGVDVASGGQCQHVFTAHGDVLDKQALQRRDHLWVGLVLQHRVWQADQSL